MRVGCIPKIIYYLHLDKIQHTDMHQDFAVRRICERSFSTPSPPFPFLF